MTLLKTIIKQAVVLCFFILPFSVSHIAFATNMYKWVDKDGNTQYTQSPPPADVEFSKMKPPPKINSESSQKALEERTKNLEELREQRHKTANEKKAAKAEEDRLKKNCETAKANLASYVMPRVKITHEDGTVTRATEEERQRRIAEAKERVAEFCK